MAYRHCTICGQVYDLNADNDHVCDLPEGVEDKLRASRRAELDRLDRRLLEVQRAARAARPGNLTGHKR